MEVSVIIRAKNEARSIGECIAAIRRQQAGRQVEVVVVDSGSTDETGRIAREGGAKVVEIPAAGFTFGKSFNAGARAATGRFLAVLAAHSIPAHEEWLENLLRNFADEKVAGVYGRHLPRNTHPLEEKDITLAYPAVRREQTNDRYFSCTNAALRRDLWEREPFTERIIYNDDFEWAGRMQRQGWKIVYEPEAAVFHAHNYSWRTIYRRTYSENKSFVHLDGGSILLVPQGDGTFPVPHWARVARMKLRLARALARAWVLEVGSDLRYVRAHSKSPRYMLYSPAYRFFKNKGVYDGTVAGTRELEAGLREEPTGA